MADIKERDTDAEIKEIARAINTQAKLLAEIVKAADHIVKSYIELTTVKESTDVKTEEVKKEDK